MSALHLKYRRLKRQKRRNIFLNIVCILITANYRETQIANIYIGQPVRIKVDGLPGRVLHGHVTAISEATGSKYSLVPTDNSAGNFVKVQQRIPVRIDLDDVDEASMGLLRAGMMVETEALKKK